MSIKLAQNHLISLGYGALLGKWGADGIPGPQTYEALRHARAQAGIKGTKHFKISEFRCKGSGQLPSGGIDNNLILKLE